MHVAVVGGGQSGHAIERAIIERGATVEMFSRSNGFDVLRDDGAARFGQAEVIVEATGQFTMSKKAATDFFTRSTRAIAATANTSGARHILLSIVNCDLPQVQGYGYFAGKTAQEEVARAESKNLTIVRSTQWFEFAAQNLARIKVGPLAFVPGMTIQPVALDAVGAVIADCALGTRTDALTEVSGPDVMTLWEMTTGLRQRKVVPVPLPLPGRMGRAFRDGALLPNPDAEAIGPRFEDWKAGQP